MKVIGLTGGIASGKSTVCAYFKELGAKIIDADKVVHQLYVNDPALKAEIVSVFGTGILDKASQVINRSILGDLVFNNPVLKKKLEAMVHPRVRIKIREEIDMAKKQASPLCIVDAALLVESAWYKDFDGLIVVSADPEQQIERLMKRNNLDRAACLTRLSSQLPLDEKIKKAHWVIDNSHSLAETQKQVQELYPQLLN